MQKFLIVTIVLLIGIAKTTAQIGGTTNFEFVNISPNAHLGGIGGLNVSLPEINIVPNNPALLNPEMHQTLSLNYIPYFAQLKYSSLQYVHKFERLPVLHLGVQYFGSGQMEETDELGNHMGSYSINQYVIHTSTAHKINNYSLGGSLKFAGSQLGAYSSYALLADIGGIFQHPTKQFTVGLVIKNFGVALKKYTPEADMNLPFDVQIGASYKLEHMPLRFSVTAHHLHIFDIVYLDPNKKGPLDDQGNEIKPKKSIADKIGRHFVLGSEFLIGKSIAIRFGYNYLRRRELRLETKSGLAGFSFGASVKIKSFELAYSHAIYETSKGINFLTLNTRLGSLFKKKEKLDVNPSLEI